MFLRPAPMQAMQNFRRQHQLAYSLVRKLRTRSLPRTPLCTRILLQTVVLEITIGPAGATPAHASTSLSFADNPLWSSFLIAAWITVLNPIVHGHARRTAALLSAAAGGIIMHSTQASLLWTLITSLFCVVFACQGYSNGLFWLLLASSFGYRRKLASEDPVECSGIQGTLGGGGYRHTGISLCGQRATRSWR